MNEHIWIEAVTPALEGGRYPVKRVRGEPLRVEADIFRDGQAVIQAAVRWRRKRERRFREAPLRFVDNDRWGGQFPLDEVTRYVYTVAAWTDVFATWLADLRTRVEVGEPVTSEVAEGVALIGDSSERAKGVDFRTLRRALDALGGWDGEGRSALAIVEEPALHAAMNRLSTRADLVEYSPQLEVVVDRFRALYGSWYEMFPRSAGQAPGRHATLREAEQRLPAIRDLGFDVLYLAPIHPVGFTHRKGRNNALAAEPGDPGSVWAIGNGAGGHTAIEPQLGTLEDFDRFVRAAAEHGLEIALDFAIQCSPDHPWVREHPEWFHHRPDGTIKYAENPPKKYQDVYPLNFDTEDVKALWKEMRDVLLHWADHGVRLFRVDNPHTKPLVFWRWLIDEVKARYPEVVFLSEAFTRPKVMKALAKVGFTQSYTYFTWRNGKDELAQYLTELTQTELPEYFRPNFFTNTPDILHDFLQKGGPPAFRIRLLLAALLSPSYGIYSGFELCENDAVAASEEYLNSEKYEIKVRDWNAPGNLNALIAKVNAIRRENPALQQLVNLRFLPADSDQMLFFAKWDAEGSNRLLIAINLDPFSTHECTVTVPPQVAGVAPGQPYGVTDLLTGVGYTWGERNYVRLSPDLPAHILVVERRAP
ncbi:MAG: alpha-1,4-glucan--maltose-1-phosphate maltosyltransferase [Candidatus Lambdaproteobacteria bacterium]|nr:alpha-1,4-glucan--maltose-1-phosphate maltosyltransferase [Candidatus Lambdaproteobacteria bacterium]